MPYETYEKLVSEAGAYNPPPQGWEFYNPLTQRRKSQDRYVADQRRLYVLERLKDVESGAPNVLGPAPLRRQLASPVEPYAKPGYAAWDPDKEEIVQVPGQYLGEDSPAWKALTWMGSPVSAVANASRALANQADRAVSYVVGQEPVEQYPGAWDKAQKDFRTFTSALPRGGAVVYREGEEPQRQDTRWADLEDMREVQDQGPFQVIDPRAADRRIQEENYAPDQIDMVDLYEGAGLPENAAWALGTVGNIVTDPGAAMLSVPSLVKQGMKPAAWKALGFDVATGVAPELLMQAPEVYRRASESDVTQQIRDLLPGRY
jgi:hypothetical protein